MTIAIGSTNPTKIKSVQIAVEKLFPNKCVEYKHCSVQSGVSDQPKSSSESVNGAINRANNVFNIFPNADYTVGIEGGIETVSVANNKNVYLQSGWVVVMNQQKEIGIGTSARVELSDKVMKPILNDGKELGDVMDDLSGQNNVKTHQGYFGLVTNNNLPRADAYVHGVLFAFSKFVSPQIYWKFSSKSAVNI
eukprot:264217_1